MDFAKLSFASKLDALTVQRFVVHEEANGLFEAVVVATSAQPDVDGDPLVGREAALHVATGYRGSSGDGERTLSGIVRDFGITKAVVDGLSHYRLTLVPPLWLLSMRQNHRIFQHQAIPDIVKTLFAEWSIEARWDIDASRFPKLETRTQYGETDLAFVHRLLEEAGIGYVLIHDAKRGCVVKLDDTLERSDERARTIKAVDNPNEASEEEYVTKVRVAQRVAPSKAALTDFTFLNPRVPIAGASVTVDGHARAERHGYAPGLTKQQAQAPGDTPVADRRGAYRHDAGRAGELAQRRLDRERRDRIAVAFHTNAFDLRPGLTVVIEGGPEAVRDEKLLITRTVLEGEKDERWSAEVHAQPTRARYVPDARTPRPVVRGVQSAIVTGPVGEEIHCDEHGRVRVLFPWDRAGKPTDESSGWLRVASGWAGSGFGMMQLPRVGQEVLVAFVDGNPDEPVVQGRAFNGQSPVVHKLPKEKVIAAYRSHTSPGGEGLNEVHFDDEKDDELVFVQAQKNMRQLIKNDDVTTVGRDRLALIKRDQRETTARGRTQVVEGARATLTDGASTEVVGGRRESLVKGRRDRRFEGSLTELVGGRDDLRVGGDMRVRVEGGEHGVVAGARATKIADQDALTVGGDRLEAVGGRHALAANTEIHLDGGMKVVLEAGADLTLKGPGGFVRIDALGVHVRGNLVKINSGGSSSDGAGAKPKLPKKPKEARVPKPPKRIDEVLALKNEHQIPMPEVDGWPTSFVPPADAKHTTDRAQGDDTKRAVHWIGIELVDDQGRPIAKELVEITLPDGRKRTATLDEHGKAKIEGIKDPGNCQIRFPRLAKKLWEKV